jgi:alkanesulfonate monooxygenase SsuD/methylene tetrahydromethanopterin reductase-like flavin-dependent oxidoreductase (luciferase family)
VAPLHVGVILPNYGAALDADRLASVALAAEEAGFDSGWVTDHVIVPADHAQTYGTIAEALVSLGFLAGRTQRLQLGVSALVVPQRQPLVALKQLTTLDFLSGGRNQHGGGSRTRAGFQSGVRRRADALSRYRPLLEKCM